VDARLVVGSAEVAQIHRGADAPIVLEMAARFMACTIIRSIASSGTCRLALAGGSTPRGAYQRLAARDLSEKIDWRRVSVFFGDERKVPPDDPSSNYRMAREALLERVPIPAENVYRMEGELPAAFAAQRYSAALGASPLDLVLLGMGEDGHVASLFPRSAELDSPASVLPAHAPVPPHERITLGLGAINAARVVALLVTGAGKASRVRDVFAERAGGHRVLPAARVSPENGELHWFLDDTAAVHLMPISPSTTKAHDQKERVS
jgi:6-phosphogluconolactonase